MCFCRCVLVGEIARLIFVCLAKRWKALTEKADYVDGRTRQLTVTVKSSLGWKQKLACMRLSVFVCDVVSVCGCVWVVVRVSVCVSGWCMCVVLCTKDVNMQSKDFLVKLIFQPEWLSKFLNAGVSKLLALSLNVNDGNNSNNNINDDVDNDEPNDDDNVVELIDQILMRPPPFRKTFLSSRLSQLFGASWVLLGWKKAKSTCSYYLAKHLIGLPSYKWLSCMWSNFTGWLGKCNLKKWGPLGNTASWRLAT